ncbi:UbiX family flavin prenyltransferase [Azospirillum sp. ST 5-10]|uniref:UbiX family flavin prenyltransferase n=1 Tax=unclassified Azospirillum TaxID=2630922 RepID=UPI003F49CE1B
MTEPEPRSAFDTPPRRETPRRLIVGMSGASGVIYGIRTLQMVKALGIEAHLVMSRSAEVTVALETDWKLADLRALAAVVHPVDDIAASISSGSFRTMGMVVAPCSMRSMSEIASGVTASLLTRAADVVLKERRRLVLMVRETPLHLGHLRTMTALAEMGAVIAPPVPAFYAKPAGLDDMVNHTVGRVLDLFDLDVGTLRRWGEEPRRSRRPVAGRTMETAVPEE